MMILFQLMTDNQMYISKIQSNVNLNFEFRVYTFNIQIHTLLDIYMNKQDLIN